jgi:hypothetical protein
VSYLPPPVIAAAIVAALAIPVLLVLLSWGPAAWRHPGRRFKRSVVAGWILWLPILLVTPVYAPAHPLDWLAGAAVLLASTLLSFNAWTILVYGVTSNMLVALMQAERPLDLDSWADRYSGGRSLSQIFLDRLGHLLLFRLAYRAGDTVHVAPRSGRAATAVLAAVNFVFGLTPIGGA